MPILLALACSMVMLGADAPAPRGPEPVKPHAPKPSTTAPDASNPDGAPPDPSNLDPSKPDLSKPDPAKPDPAKPAPNPTPAPAPTPAPLPAVAFPHPLITEVLFAVPSAGEADANKSGKREVQGDEFIELVNPHDRPIELKGYTLTDGSPTAKRTLKFTFPAMTLPAHAVVVVFNGHESKIPGPVGDAKSAPASGNDNFHKARVLAIRPISSQLSFSNSGDAACLKSPSGACIQRVRWGKADEKTGGVGFALDEIAPANAKGSVQRDGITKNGSWLAHAEVDSTPFSPGEFAPLTPKPTK